MFFRGLDQPHELFAELRPPIANQGSPSNSRSRFLGIQNLPRQSRALCAIHAENIVQDFFAFNVTLTRCSHRYGIPKPGSLHGGGCC
jgi:hypothetical protein